MSPQNLPAVLREVGRRIARAAAAAGRNAQSVTLLAVGKGQLVELLAAAADCGVTDFGENYLQEALAKVAALQNRALTWHFIGRIQANKTRPIADTFTWVHTLDRLKVAERLAAQRPFHAPPLNVCLQVNIAGEVSKGGVAPGELPALAAAVAQLSRLTLRGLMCIPPEESEPARQRTWFARLRVLRDGLNAAGHRLDTLSMGMSADFESAIQEGATIIRLGTVLFGARPP
ncbi:MAG: YggS family pyridoxal phosphate-dependent enzyme [Sinobacteraceae bacterium]|nr:YggS family pyridoxal phosphate-dependent enzyme [Nevskiaceae bacterium]MBV9317281.1 YggS family pyridoxal phosphate-dependent enzyme [Gammaproteobacteria bacterium]